MLRKVGTICVMLTLALFLIIAGCKKKPEKGAEDTKSKPEYKSKGDEGTITGKIAFDGTPPVGKKIDMSQDAQCASAATDKTVDDIVVTDGKLQNVFVYVKGGGVEKFSYDVPSDPVVLDQQGCRYHPRVMGIQTQQTLKIVNSDPTTHNIHPSPKLNPEFNQSQPQGAPPIEKKFNRKEILIPVKCNQHPWMKANIAVLDHPYFAVSAKDGSYTIKNVPPGTYTIVFWHETLGEQTASITVAAKESKTQDMTYKAGAAAAPASMEIAPTLVLP
ncbi:MAG TPA: carboxypeptidase regulatory-like domain-containing protein [Blastocatellia bacterium]|nr:carboxypeptidase regulatory-like domain-containing protein [Blastocatellia bacterium]